MAEEWDFYENSIQDQYFETSTRKSPSLRKLEISMKLIGEDVRPVSNPPSEKEIFVPSLSDKELIGEDEILEQEPGEEAEEEEEWPKPDESTISIQEEPSEELGAEEKKSEFTVSLWTTEESSEVKSIESWDIPQGSVAWNDNDKPIQKLLQYAELDLTEEEENGLLTDRIVAACCSYLTKLPDSKECVVAKVVLDNKV